MRLENPKFAHYHLDDEDPAIPDPAAIPIRTTPLGLPLEALQEINRREGRRGARAYEDTWVAGSRAKEAQSMSPDRLQAHLTHPSEVVAIALLDNRQEPLPYKEDRVRVWHTLYQRAVRDADRDGFVWTPLLDVLDATGHWPAPVTASAEDWPGTGQTGAMAYPWQLFPGEVATASWEALSDRLARLLPWIERQTDPASAWAVVAPCRSNAVQHHVLMHLPVWSRAFLAARLREEPELAAVIARNPHLPPELQTALAWYTLQSVHTVAIPVELELLVDYRAGAERASPARDDVLRSWTGSSRVRADAATVLRALVTAGWTPPDDLVTAVARPAAAHPSGSRQTTEQLAREVHNQCRALDALGLFVSDAQLAGLARQATTVDQQRALLASPAAGVALYGALAEGKGFTAVREALAELPAAREDPGVRAALARSSNATVLSALAFAAPTPADFRRLLRRALPHDVWATHERLLAQAPWVGPRGIWAGRRGEGEGAVHGPVFALTPDCLAGCWSAEPEVQLGALRVLRDYPWLPEHAAGAAALCAERVPRVLRRVAVPAQPVKRPWIRDDELAAPLRTLLAWLATYPGPAPLSAEDLALAVRTPFKSASEDLEALTGSDAAVLRRLLELFRAVPLALDARVQLWREHARCAPAILAASLRDSTRGDIETVLADHALMAWLEPAALVEVLQSDDSDIREAGAEAVSVVGTGRTALPPEERSALHVAEAAAVADSPMAMSAAPPTDPNCVAPSPGVSRRGR